MQTLTHDHLSTTTQRNSFIVSTPDKLLATRAIKTQSAFSLCVKSLTPRETEILELQGTGLSIKGVARKLAISPGTVKWHVRNMYWKLDATSREEALAKARQYQIIS
ncbi:MAG: LuxR C-terminal-related transcriptional regulator [Pseudomonadota bacterium]